MTPATSFPPHMLSATSGAKERRRVLVVGAGGTAGEIIAAARLQEPGPLSPSILRHRCSTSHAIIWSGPEVSDRVETVLGTVLRSG